MVEMIMLLNIFIFDLLSVDSSAECSGSGVEGGLLTDIITSHPQPPTQPSH